MAPLLVVKLIPFVSVFDFFISTRLFVVCLLLIPAAVVAIIKLPVATSKTAVAGAALGAVRNLAAGNAENRAKLGSAGGCEGGWVSE